MSGINKRTGEPSPGPPLRYDYMKFDFSKEPGRKLLDRGLSADGAPLISVITPYYNAGKYFEQTFNCVLNQTFPWFEWIIVDDGSTDEESVRILERLAARDKRIRIYRKKNGGISTARNLAIEHSTTEIIVPLDADDLLTPAFLETQYWALKCNPDYDWSYCNNIGFQNQEYLWDKPFDPELLRTYNFLVYCGAIRKNVMNEAGRYDEITKHYFEDWRLWLKLLSLHKKPVKTHDYGFWYRRTDTGVLSAVRRDPKTRALADRLIREAAETADISVRAKEYPIRGLADGYAKPKPSGWDRKVFASHEKIHVLMLLPWLEMGGADRFNLDLCAGVDKARFEIGIITTQAAENTWKQRFEEHVADIFCLPDFLDRENWPEFVSYFIKSREVDVLFLSNSYYGYYLLPWLRKEFPDLAILDYVHMEEWYWRRGGYARTSGAMGGILEKTYVCNEKTRQVLIHDFGRGPESVETLYIGVDEAYYDPSGIRPGRAKKKLGIAPERPMILFPCRLHPQKRPFLMLEIAKKLKKELPGAAIAVVGDGPQLAELKKAAKREKLKNTVYFANRREDMRPWYRDAALTLLCSLKEGVALTAYESLAMGVPVITSDTGGQGELIDESVGRLLPLMQNEETGVDVRSFDAAEISQYADAVRELLSDRAVYEKMSAACRRRIEEGFRLEGTIHRMEDIFADLVRDGQKQAARREASAALRRIGSVVDDALGTYLRLEAKESELEEVWKRSEWFREKYEAALAKNGSGASKSALAAPVFADGGEAQRMLDEIYNMRTWKLIQKYRRFMDETLPGAGLRKVRDFLRHHG